MLVVIKAILYEGAVALRASMNFRKHLRVLSSGLEDYIPGGTTNAGSMDMDIIFRRPIHVLTDKSF